MKDLSNKEIKHVVNNVNEIEYLQFKKLLKYKDKLVHCYTLKRNLDFRNYNDRSSSLEDSYKLICKELNLDKNKIVRPYQTHTDCVKIVKNTKENLENVDGIITQEKSLVTSLTFADCTPLFFYDPEKNVIANIHSGWKGTLNKIGQKTVKKMIQKLKCNPKDIICCIGPAIGKCHFEVENDVKELFEKEFKYTKRINEIIEKADIKDGKQKYHIDTNLINRIILEEVGLKPENIIESNICTVCNSDYMHSYRTEKDLSGRNSAIMSLI